MEQLECHSVVVGAGPAGCIAALGMAKKGKQVLLLEGDPAQEKRLAGEWLHPVGAEVLARHGIPREKWPVAPKSGGKGFVVLPPDGAQPVILDYPAGRQGLVLEHADLLAILRQECDRCPSIRYVPFAMVKQVSRGEVLFEKPNESAGVRVVCERIVGADGKKSIVRRSLGGPTACRLISYMYGFLLEGAELPYEGYGLVIPADPGILILYRVGPNRVRLLVDVPLAVQKQSPDPGLMLTRYRDRLPESVRTGYTREVNDRAWSVRANLFRQRTFYGNEAVSLIGDAVGFHHPITAMGMTLGLEDAEGIVRANSFREFVGERLLHTFVPELVVQPLYEAFAGDSESSHIFREALCRMWRRSATDRESTMSLLSGEETSVFRFTQSFLRGAQSALTDSVRLPFHQERLTDTATLLGRITYLLTKQSTRRIVPMLGRVANSRFGAVS